MRYANFPSSEWLGLIYEISDSLNASQLQESDLQGHEWLHMYAEFAFHYKWMAHEVGSSLI